MAKRYMFMNVGFTALQDRTGPAWEEGQRAEYVSELKTACRDRARELGLDGLIPGNLDAEDRAFEEACFEEAIQAAVEEIPARLERDMSFRNSWGREQWERLANEGRSLFSDEPTAGQYLAWEKFEFVFYGAYERLTHPRAVQVIQQALARGAAEQHVEAESDAPAPAPANDTSSDDDVPISHLKAQAVGTAPAPVPGAASSDEDDVPISQMASGAAASSDDDDVPISQLPLPKKKRHRKKRRRE